MTSEIVIRVEGLGKRYRIGQRETSGQLREVLGRALHSPLEVFRRAPRETFWALKDVSLEVREGEVLGLVGRNGAGKTTLLKILSRITRPTEGWAEIRGHVGSLLEVGTGFHPDLTGRENTYLSGAILGMTKSDIDRKFDEIVAFAELEKFIDTQVKHYSSGMYVRLAFAVAAHLEPEILLVDEVLAVGDIKFQKKCLGKMGDVARAGRTAVLVTHQLNQIRRLCHRAVWIDDGEIRQNGAAAEVAAAYEFAMAQGSREQNSQIRTNAESARFTQWELAGASSGRAHTLVTAGGLTVNFVVQLARPIAKGEHGVALFNAERQLMWASAARRLQLEPGVHVFSHTLPSLPVRPGAYQWQVSLWEDGKMLDLWDCEPEMNVATESFQHSLDQWNGVLNISGEFSHLMTEESPVGRTSNF